MTASSFPAATAADLKAKSCPPSTGEGFVQVSTITWWPPLAPVAPLHTRSDLKSIGDVSSHADALCGWPQFFSPPQVLLRMTASSYQPRIPPHNTTWCQTRALNADVRMTASPPSPCEIVKFGGYSLSI